MILLARCWVIMCDSFYMWENPDSEEQTLWWTVVELTLKPRIVGIPFLWLWVAALRATAYHLSGKMRLCTIISYAVMIKAERVSGKYRDSHVVTRKAIHALMDQQGNHCPRMHSSSVIKKKVAANICPISVQSQSAAVVAQFLFIFYCILSSKTSLRDQGDSYGAQGTCFDCART